MLQTGEEVGGGTVGGENGCDRVIRAGVTVGRQEVEIISMGGVG